jgi:hypothetical protein
MPRDPRFDFRKGVNSSFSEDALDRSELLTATNARLSKYGALEKRAGSQRIHTDEIESGTKILGMIQWDDPGGVEIALVCNSDFYHKTLAATTFTEIAGTMATTGLVVMVQHSIAGTATLYIADGGLLNSFDGTTLTENIAGTPSATYIELYKGRMFACDGTKTLYWSKIADPDDWTTAGGGGSSPVGFYGTEGIVALKAVGASLLVFKEDSIARFTGTTQATISIDAETQGVSPDVGCIAPGTVTRVEDFVFFLSDRGPYIATEGGVQAVGEKVEDQFDPADWADAFAVHNRDRQEVWVFDGATDGIYWIWNYRLFAWTGPHNFGGTFFASCAARRELSTGAESIMVGGHDGWVRDGDIETYDAKDDVVNAGTGGTAITMSCQLPPLLEGDAGRFKMLRMIQVQADLKTSGALTLTTNSDDMTSTTLTIDSDGTGVRRYRRTPVLRGYRPSLTLSDATSEIIRVNGLEMNFRLGRYVA